VTISKSRAGYILVFERSRTGYAAYAPDVPGCVSTGRTLAKTKRNMEAALTLHLRATRKAWLPVQRPRSLAELRRKRLVPVAAQFGGEAGANPLYPGSPYFTQGPRSTGPATRVA
jgi:predicted RNase H-like HicB family nuclease